jgi:signal transduction histidine kinase
MAEPHLPTAIEQAEALQDRLVKVAYGLHFSCENIAALMEQRGELRPVASTDYPTEAKRWREAGTQALDLVRLWGHSRVPELSGRRHADAQHDVVCRRAAGDLADTVMNTLYTAILRIDSAMCDVDEQADTRLRDVADLLETSIREVRRVIVDLTEAMPTAGAEHAVTD